MNRHSILTIAALTALGLACLPSSAMAQQTGPTMHKYLSRAVLTPEGIKNLQKQPPTALKAGIAKFTESVGGKMESGISILPHPPAGRSSTTPTKSLPRLHK